MEKELNQFIKKHSDIVLQFVIKNENDANNCVIDYPVFFMGNVDGMKHFDQTLDDLVLNYTNSILGDNIKKLNNPVKISNAILEKNGEIIISIESKDLYEESILNVETLKRISLVYRIDFKSIITSFYNKLLAQFVINFNKISNVI